MSSPSPCRLEREAAINTLLLLLLLSLAGCNAERASATYANVLDTYDD
jgi:hypothetical protein